MSDLKLSGKLKLALPSWGLSLKIPAYLALVPLILGSYTILKFSVSSLLKVKRMINSRVLKKNSFLRKAWPQNNKWALVSNSTTKLGRGFIQNLAKNGFSLILISPNIQALDEQVAALTIEFPHSNFKALYIYENDFRDSDKFCKRLTSTFSRLDIHLFVICHQSHLQDNSFNFLQNENEIMFKRCVLTYVLPCFINKYAVLSFEEKIRDNPDKYKGAQRVIVNVNEAIQPNLLHFSRPKQSSFFSASNFERYLNNFLRRHIDIEGIKFINFTNILDDAKFNQRAFNSYTEDFLEKLGSDDQEIYPNVFYKLVTWIT
jgi:hypothetical protein